MMSVTPSTGTGSKFASGCALSLHTKWDTRSVSVHGSNCFSIRRGGISNSVTFFFDRVFDTSATQSEVFSFVSDIVGGSLTVEWRVEWSGRCI